MSNVKKGSCFRCNDRYDLVASMQSTFPLARVAHYYTPSTPRHIEAFERGVLSHGPGGLLHPDSIISDNIRIALELSVDEINKSTSIIKKLSPRTQQMHLSSMRNIFTDMYRQTGEFRYFISFFYFSSSFHYPRFLFLLFLPLSQGMKFVCMNREQWVRLDHERNSLSMMTTPPTVLK